MKTCPSCGTDVPESAARCKSCFHDFSEDTGPKRSWGPIMLLGTFALMAVIGAFTLAIIVSYPLEQRILVDEETQSIIFTTQYRGRIETDRIRFDDVKRVEHVERVGEFVVRAVTEDGDEHTIEVSKQPLEGAAEHYADIMKKPLEKVSEIGFMPGKEEE